jgi:hypothetical protein
MDTDTDRQADTDIPLKTGSQALQRGQYAETGTHSSLRIVFMRQRITKVHQQPTPQILGDRALKALDDLRTDLVISAHHSAEILRVELSCKLRSVYQVTTEHGEMTALRSRWSGCSSRQYGLLGRTLCRRILWRC